MACRSQSAATFSCRFGTSLAGSFTSRGWQDQQPELCPAGLAGQSGTDCSTTVAVLNGRAFGDARPYRGPGRHSDAVKKPDERLRYMVTQREGVDRDL